MKLCVFSDIHGNGPAFEAAYALILAEHADINIFLGDLCGYYYDQLEVFQLLCRMPNLIAVKGNHDAIFLEILKGNERVRKQYLQKYGMSMEHLLAQEYTELVSWLTSLPSSYRNLEHGCVCIHGSPQDPLDGYVYPDSSLQFFRELPERFFFLGHTHYRMHKRIGDKYVVNPGSVGQPRDGGRPTYVVVDLGSGNVSFREVVYDLESLKKRIDEIGDENKYLRQILDRQLE